jgi:hypothetical protein
MNLPKIVLALSLIQGNHGMQPSDRIRQISGSAAVPEAAQRWGKCGLFVAIFFLDLLPFFPRLILSLPSRGLFLLNFRSVKVVTD